MTAPGHGDGRLHSDARVELIRLLRGACEIEHALMLQYLYAAYSLRPAFAALAGDHREGGSGLIGIALEEMHHLRDVNRVLVELGGAPCLARQGFPYQPDVYPFPMVLEPLCRRSVARYLFAEAPGGRFRVLEAGAAEAADLDDEVVGLLEGEGPLNKVGSLYRSVLGLLDELDDPRVPRWRRLLVGVKSEGETDHFRFFADVFSGRHPALRGVADPWPDIAFPLTTADEAALPASEAADHAYWAALLLLDLAYRSAGETRAALLGLANALMTGVLHPLGRSLAAAGVGMAFTALPARHAPGLDGRENLEITRVLVADAEGHARRAAGLAAGVVAGLSRVARGLAELSRSDPAGAFAAPVLVAGAGPAGLAAAAALTSRGVPVRVVERAPVLGGKAFSHESGGRSLEHGVHGWWHDYRNFDRLLEDVGVDPDEALRYAPGGGVLVEDGRVDFLGTGSLPLPSPLSMAAYLAHVKQLTLGDWLSVIPFSIHALGFDHARDYARYDGISFATLMHQHGVSERLRKLVLTPFTLCFDYTAPERVSAASVLSAFQLYLMPSQKSVLPRWSRGLPERTVFAPIARAIRDRGGRIELGTCLEKVEIEDGEAKRAVVRELRAEPGPRAAREHVYTLPRSRVPTVGFETHHTGAGPVLVGPQDGRAGGPPCAFLARCPHRGGTVEWRGGEFACPEHGRRFAPDGSQRNGAGESDLTACELRPSGDELHFYAAVRRSVARCSHVIVATDLRAAQAILRESEGVPAPLLERVSRLKTTPVVVVRLWFRAGTATPDFESIVFPERQFADVFFNVTRFDPSYEREGVIVELHSCDDEGRWSDASEREILDAVFQDLGRLPGELREANLHADHAPEISRQPSLFTLYGPGEYGNRPGAGSGVAGLHLAGDWTRADQSHWMMERAVVSGLRAANRVLRAYGEEPVPIEQLDPENPLLRLSRAASRVVRWALWPGSGYPRRRGPS